MIVKSVGTKIDEYGGLRRKAPKNFVFFFHLLLLLYVALLGDIGKKQFSNKQAHDAVQNKSYGHIASCGLK